jgi:hypothetical protein
MEVGIVKSLESIVTALVAQPVVISAVVVWVVAFR